jgi:hypothetical protein
MAPVRAAVAAAALLLAVLLGGCSDDNAAPSASTTPGQPTMAPQSGGSAQPSQQPSPVATSRPPTTPVPATTSGNVNQTVPSKAVTSRPPVKLDKPAKPTGDVVVTLPSIKAINAKGQGPGEVSGPALAVTVRVQNNGDKPVDLSNTVVNLTAANGDPGAMMTGSPASPLPSEVKAGKTASGVYVFAVPKNQRDPITVEASINPDVPVVVFRGTP